MKTFTAKQKKFFFAWFCIVILIFLQILPYKKQENFLFKIVYGTLGELQTMSVNFHSGIRDILSKYLFLLHLQKENKQLKTQNAQLVAQNQILEELKRENVRLKKIFQFSQRRPQVFLLAQVVANDFLSQNKLLIINKGSQHGVKKYMGVIHTKGVVGYIFRVGLHSSQVIPLDNKLSVLPVAIQQNRLKGLVAGEGSQKLYFKYFNLQSTFSPSFKEGDQIITSLSNHFPSGIPVGEVYSFSNKERIRVKPYVNISQIEEVFVLLSTSAKQKNKEKERE